MKTNKLDLKIGRKEEKGVWTLSLPDTSDLRSPCCHHFREAETEAGRLKPRAEMPHSQLRIQLSMFCLMYKLPSKDKKGFSRGKRKELLLLQLKFLKKCLL